MADEPNWQPADAPPWAKQQAEPNWQPAEAPPWAKEKPAERSVLERAGSAMAETFRGGVEAAKTAFTPPSKEEAKKYLWTEGGTPLRPFKETGEALLSPLTTTAGPLMAGAESL